MVGVSKASAAVLLHVAPVIYMLKAYDIYYRAAPTAAPAQQQRTSSTQLSAAAACWPCRPATEGVGCCSAVLRGVRCVPAWRSRPCVAGGCAISRPPPCGCLHARNEGATRTARQRVRATQHTAYMLHACREGTCDCPCPCTRALLLSLHPQCDDHTPPLPYHHAPARGTSASNPVYVHAILEAKLTTAQADAVNQANGYYAHAYRGERGKAALNASTCPRVVLEVSRDTCHPDTHAHSSRWPGRQRPPVL